jgi:hypothetical protein
MPSARARIVSASVPPSGCSTTTIRHSGSPKLAATRRVSSTNRVVVTTTVGVPRASS